ncbi:hypothetical protein A2630_04460 [Candidatus Woesebacteria bacterium RIFCSPHIGHO2_01_FULL_44_10]|uniref:Glycosyltransferase 2-like domain-containing protein n=1 Tax=Candidatus Woesebacteria bacterium RIFCSPLOWO2_01_FULL_44_14 TaxID=1802525 RepID=A0A1F8C4Z0_9BACT|nr:MAG: hypothetical protein A2630_04460 [Candidatus Woesebacteria bacterium RIFCSPHIGHO2_01_FULL_44_10]OGM56032.1 MAG: hypothetical protein A3F62_03885 [Candidatus Woesebacteria bacterium RIFCSPHIGHO2_12_FULL_44_11]OGM70755.1 MAG: hypothetical protein A2975_02595 [Candidatus Woesebacteria bacterium RIFCSPLOWO2_01_FULL_44_14]
MQKSHTKPKLSVVILSHNTKDLLVNCLKSLEKVKNEVDFETIVVDNGSTDGSIKTIRHAEFISASDWVLKLVQNDRNVGFAAGNNKARDMAGGKYVLFLNSDTQVYLNTLPVCIKYLDEHEEVGAMTCRLEMRNGKLDPDSRRSFPTPWKSFTHFSGLENIFPHSSLFSQYRYGRVPEDRIQEVDVIQGAFFLTRKKILDKVGWFDEDYFLDGEDIDLCWRIKKAGYKIIYYPKVSILHVKKGTKGKTKRSKQTVTSGINAMEVFYKKHLMQKYPALVNGLVFAGIKILRFIRLVRFVA